MIHKKWIIVNPFNIDFIQIDEACQFASQMMNIPQWSIDEKCRMYKLKLFFILICILCWGSVRANFERQINAVSKLLHIIVCGSLLVV